MSGLFVDNNGRRSWREVFYRVKGCFAVVLSLAVLIGGGFFAYKYVSNAYAKYTNIPDYTGDGKAAIIVTIPKGATLTDVGYILLDKDVIKSAKAWKNAVDDNRDAHNDKLQAGNYRLRTQLPAATALAEVLNPANRQITKVTIPEGYRNTKLFRVLQQKTGVKAATWQAASKNTSGLGLPTWVKNNPEGVLYPETYEFDAPVVPAVELKRMVDQFKTVAADLDFEAKAAKLGQQLGIEGLTVYDVLIVASILQMEVKNKDMPMAASVLYNRLRDGDQLQLDSTVIYANNVEGKLTTTEAQRQNPSPYNTYTHDGLPPGPISNPGRVALEAALNPATSDYKFFVVVDPVKGTTIFTKTSWEHEQAVNDFQAWCQANPGKC